MEDLTNELPEIDDAEVPRRIQRLSDFQNGEDLPPDTVPEVEYDQYCQDMEAIARWLNDLWWNS